MIEGSAGAGDTLAGASACKHVCGGKMKEFRAFVLDESDHVKGHVNLLCTDDDDAKQQAGELVVDCPIELWEGKRRIARIDIGRHEDRP